MKKLCVILSLSMLVVMVFGLTACENDFDGYYRDSKIIIRDQPVRTSSHTLLLDTDYWSVKIVGKVEARSSLSIIMLEFSLYNSSGSKIDTAYATGGTLQKGEVWEFEASAVLVTQNPASAKLVSVTAF
ncbi:MAG: FxLYD domain-containing protein [Firmicutes bacterium]|nr:FxLYD domain-containing protein [Bacillota bacterium]